MVAEALADKSPKVTKNARIEFNANLDDTGTLFDPSATVEIVAAVPGKRIVITNLNHVQISFSGGQGSVGVEFKSGSTALTGQILFSNIPSGGGYEMTTNTSYMPDGHFWTEKGEALNITITDTAAANPPFIPSAQPIWVYGYINYYEE